mmetsp:Transcript_6729/g.16890  ORF Transcript_6729/g.16890 Transcript_6729/m.16890 type:complete len:84 (+) Transcript_6729:198-449(+)
MVGSSKSKIRTPNYQYHHTIHVLTDREEQQQKEKLRDAYYRVAAAKPTIKQTTANPGRQRIKLCVFPGGRRFVGLDLSVLIIT